MIDASKGYGILASSTYLPRLQRSAVVEQHRWMTQGLKSLAFERLRDVMGLQIGDGTAGVMKLIVARERVGKPSKRHAGEQRARSSKDEP